MNYNPIPGSRWFYQGHHCVMTNVAYPNFVLESLSTHEVWPVNLNQLVADATPDADHTLPINAAQSVTSCAEDDLRFQGAPRAQQENVMRTKAILQEFFGDNIDEMLKFPRAVAKKRLKRHKRGLSWLYEQKNRWEEKKHLVSFLPHPRSDKGKPRDAQRAALIEEKVREIYVSPSETTVQDTTALVNAALAQKGLTVSRSEVTRIVRAMNTTDPMGVAEARLGKKAARDRFLGVGQSFADNLRPLQVVEIDHTLLDILLVDEHFGVVIGRPWVTVAIDAKTRCIWSMVVSLDHPNSMTVAHLLYLGCTYRDWQAEFGTEKPHRICGIPAEILIDNGRDLCSEHVQSICAVKGITINRRPPGDPRFGGVVERFMGTLASFVRNLPGTTWGSPKKKGDRKPEKRACISLADFEARLWSFCIDGYQQREHSGLGMPPAQAWNLALASGAAVPVFAEDSDAERLLYLKPHTAKLQRDSVQINGLRYWASEFRSMPKCKMEFRYDPRDVSRIFLKTEKRIIVAPCTGFAKMSYPVLPATSIWEIRAVRRALRAKSEGLSKAEFGRLLMDLRRKPDARTRKSEMKKLLRLDEQRLDRQRKLSQINLTDVNMGVESDSDAPGKPDWGARPRDAAQIICLKRERRLPVQPNLLQDADSISSITAPNYPIRRIVSR